mmetsp:Transcript_166261/g.528233  ORF Transcript_166261/g.528233 Transcript_166261/m.528233 type:complete len:211 (-) Transcript_166261:3-635(-)
MCSYSWSSCSDSMKDEKDRLGPASSPLLFWLLPLEMPLGDSAFVWPRWPLASGIKCLALTSNVRPEPSSTRTSQVRPLSSAQAWLRRKASLRSRLGKPTFSMATSRTRMPGKRSGKTALCPEPSEHGNSSEKDPGVRGPRKATLHVTAIEFETSSGDTSELSSSSSMRVSTSTDSKASSTASEAGSGWHRNTGESIIAPAPLHSQVRLGQ